MFFNAIAVLTIIDNSFVSHIRLVSISDGRRFVKSPIRADSENTSISSFFSLPFSIPSFPLLLVLFLPSSPLKRFPPSACFVIWSVCSLLVHFLPTLHCLSPPHSSLLPPSPRRCPLSPSPLSPFRSTPPPTPSDRCSRSVLGCLPRWTAIERRRRANGRRVGWDENLSRQSEKRERWAKDQNTNRWKHLSLIEEVSPEPKQFSNICSSRNIHDGVVISNTPS